jgi:hypothetical protein
MSSPQRWKRQEREIAAALGGVRLPNSGRGQPDVLAGNLAVQVKTRATLPAWLVAALDQAARDATTTGPDAVPVVILSAVRAGRKARRVVVLDLDAFAALSGHTTDAAVCRVADTGGHDRDPRARVAS